MQASSRWIAETLAHAQCLRATVVKGSNTMKLPTLLNASFGFLVLATNVTFAQHVKTDYDHNVNFEKYKTYSWRDVRTQDPLWVDRIKEAVNRQLMAKGWMLAPSGGDASIVAIGTTKNHQTLDTFYNDMGGGWLWGGFGDATTTTETYTVGTLVVDIFDSNTKKLIWRGSASNTLSGKPDANIKKLDKSAQKLFEHFPPGTPKS